MAEDTLVGDERDESDERLAPGKTLGRYMITKRVGAGGSGTVYAAFDTVLDRKIALKVISPGPLGHAPTLSPGWPRLIREARLLARLSGPQLVTVYDVAEVDGLLCLAMEFVEGGDLSRWLDEPRPLPQALALMLDAGRGLAAAHEGSIVHGDFKPANVLLDSRGRAKVTDFGVARLGEPTRTRAPGDEPLHEPLSDAPTPGAGGESDQPASTTQRGRLVGTPAYMAPEQFAGHGADFRTDVYAFGTTLFQVAYGQLPHSGKSIAELATRKAMETPKRPSGVRVPPWLDRIIDRALAVDRDDRYRDMNGLLVDLHAGLSPSRTRWYVAAGITFSLVAIAGVSLAWPRSHPLCEGVSPLGWDRGARDRVSTAFEATGDLGAGETFARIDARLLAYAQSWHDAYDRTCAAVGAGESMLNDRALACLSRRRISVESLVEAWRGATPRAVRTAVRAVVSLPTVSSCTDPEALAREVSLPEDPTLRSEVVATRGEVERAMAFLRAGNLDRAQELADAARARAEQTGFAPVRAAAAITVAEVLEDRGDLEGARERLREAFFLARSVDDDEAAAQAASQLVYVAGTQLERHDEGLLWAEHARVALEKTGGDDSTLMGNEGAILDRLGRYDDAIAKYEAALNKLGDDQPYHRGVTLMRLADALRAKGKVDEAVAHYRDTVDLWTQALGQHHPNLSAAQLSLATGLARSGAEQEAIPAFEAGIATMAAAYGEDHPNVGAAYQNLGIALKHTGDLARAEEVMRKALSIARAAYGDDNPKTADRREALGRLLTKAGRPAEALEQHVESKRIYGKHLEPTHPRAVECDENIAAANAALADP